MPVKHSFIFLSVHDSEYSRTGNLHNGLIENGYTSTFTLIDKIDKSVIRSLRNLKSSSPQNAILIVGSGSQRIAILLRILGVKEFIFDAGWTLTESYLSNKTRFSFRKFIRTYILDLASFFASSRILVESEQQKKYISRYFLVHESKLKVSLTGFNETKLKHVHPKKPKEMGDELGFILFRGKRNSESGIENIASLSRNPIFSKECFVIVTNKSVSDLDWGLKVIIINRVIDNSEMMWIYKNCKVSLSQLSDSSRLRNTIPHKIYEAAHFEKISVVIKDSAAHKILGEYGAIPIDLRSDFAGELHKKISNLAGIDIQAEKAKAEIKSRLSSKMIIEKFISDL